MPASPTVLIITRDCAESLPALLESVRWCERVIITDRGSTDGTLAIAKNAKAELHFHPGNDPALILEEVLSSLAHAESAAPWVLVLAPTDRVDESLRREMQAFLTNPPEDIVGVQLSGRLHFAGQSIGGALGHLDCGPCLLKPAHARFTGGLAPTFQVEGKTRAFENPIVCEPYASVEALFDAANKQATRKAYAALEAGHAVPAGLGGWASAKWAGFEALMLQGGIFGGWRGMCLSVARGLEVFLTQAKLQQLLDGKP